MPALTSLSELARLASSEEDSAGAVASALRIVADELGATAAHLVYGVDEEFAAYSEGAPLELRRMGLWIVARELTSRHGPVKFRSTYGRVTDFGPPSSGGPLDCLAVRLTAAMTSADMLLVCGPWRLRYTRRHRDFLEAAAPLLGLLLLRRRRIADAEASQVELGTLFSISRVISESEEMPLMLMRIANTVVSLVGVDHAVIDIFAGDGSVRLRCLNQHGQGTSSYIERWTRAAQRPDPVRNIVVATREPMIFEDAQNDERLPERSRAFFAAALVHSTAVFPLLLADRVIGVLSLGSTHPTAFDGRQRELIEGVAAQIATAVHGVQLYEHRREAEAALRQSQELITATIESTADGILAVDGEGHVSYANRRFAAMWRMPEALLAAGDDAALLEFARDQLVDPEAWRARIDAIYAGSDEDLGVLTLKDGRVFERYSRPLADAGAGQAGGRPGRVWSFRDVTQRHRTEELLRDQARLDSLTRLLNHAAIEDRLHECAEQSQSVGVIVLDVDGMKAVNDLYGHVAGDDVLTAVARTLARDGAEAGRYGGDEFIVILPDTTREDAEHYCREVAAALSRAEIRDAATGALVPVSASMGLAIWPSEVRAVDDVIRVADEAMYAEKRERAISADTTGIRIALGDERATRMIGEIVPVLTSSARLDEKLRLIAGRLAEGAGYAGVRFAFDPTAASRRLVVTRLPEVSRAQDADVSPVVTAEVRATKRPVFIEDLRTDERVPEAKRTVALQAGLGAGLVVPLLADGEVAGFLSVGVKCGSRLDARDARFLAAVAEQVMAIARMEALVDDLEASAERLQDARADTVIMLAAAAEAHDSATGSHLTRVRTLSELLSRELGRNEDEVAGIGLAAILHDIGKIRVPESILLCPARLNGEEWTVMKRHTDWGAAFLRQRPGFELAAVIAQHHHERWDGGGYPSGLAGAEIPEEAAIVTVADSLDAITNDRPYRAGRSLAWAIGEISRCSGAQFNPTVVEALVRLYEKGELDFLAGDAALTEAA